MNNDLETYLLESGMSRDDFAAAISNITGYPLASKTLKSMIEGKFTPIPDVVEAARMIADELLPLHDNLVANPEYANMNPIVIAFYNAIRHDPNAQAQFEWWIAACNANPKLRNMHHKFFHYYR